MSQTISQTNKQIKSVKLGATMYRIKSVIAPARIKRSVKLKDCNKLESNLTLDWLDRIMTEVEHFTGDDWLSLCPDIDQGEIYRDWLIYHDAEISQLWEAYDYQGDRFFTAGDLSSLKQKIDRIENTRAAHPLIIEKFSA
ncbi:MAG: hypothetical protein ACRC2J_03805 [Microcoleaceae cyanobacterium]